ncbi:MAG: helix-turn-helix domain-containing protein [Oscillospiraceae bacterium]|nr:helix-turn-helix domain-containing protein [Oscillospiraceae bacterium]
MNEEFVRNRITELRLRKGVSEYKMSYDLGRSRGYMYNISSGKSQPPLKELFLIIDYFGITPAEFFDGQNRYPDLTKKIVSIINELNDEDFEVLMSVIGRIGLLRGIVNDLSRNCECNQDMQKADS